MTRQRKTKEQREADAKALHEQLNAQIDALRDTTEWTRYLAFLNKFHAYSLNNILLILSQRPEVTRVAGFRKWQELGRQVRKGERGIRIFGYSKKTIREEDNNGNETERTLVRYPITTVFDIAQTDPVDEADANPGDTFVRRLNGDDPDGIYDALAAHLAAEEWTVVRDELPGAVEGRTLREERRIIIAPHHSPADAAATLLHEAAHAVLHSQATDYQAQRPRYEAEAESVAYVLAGLAGLDTSSVSVGYIAKWTRNDPDVVREAAGNVAHAVRHLADALPKVN